MRRVIAEDAVVLPYSPQPVWNALADFASYWRWWPTSVKIHVRRATPELVGSQIEVRPFGGRGFVCEVVRVTPPTEMQLRYVAGFYRGTGVWTVSKQDDGTRVSYRIDLEIVDRFLVVLSCFINIAALHSRLMRKVLSGLDDYIAANPERGR